MLIVQRKQSETIHIGDGIVVEVLETLPGGSVRLGVKAPPDVVVVRGEQLITPATENMRAAQSDFAMRELAALLKSVQK